MKKRFYYSLCIVLSGLSDTLNGLWQIAFGLVSCAFPFLITESGQYAREYWVWRLLCRFQMAVTEMWFKK